MQFILRILIFCIGIFLCSIQAQAAYFLDVGGYSAAAHGVSADGSTVVGFNEGPRIEAFLRTQYGDIVGLGDLPGGNFSSAAYGVSADGSTVVGFSTSGFGTEAFLWTQEGGMVGLEICRVATFIALHMAFQRMDPLWLAKVSQTQAPERLSGQRKTGWSNLEFSQAPAQVYQPMTFPRMDQLWLETV